MDADERDEMEDLDRRLYIEDLKEQANRLAGGEMHAHIDESCPPEIEEQFWQHIVDFETAPRSTLSERLTEAGIELPEPDALDDAALHAKLWEIIEALAERNAWLSCTDHLSDRELYAVLWAEILPDEYEEFGPGWNMNIDILGGCSEEDIHCYNKYYADEETRRRWMEDFPDYEMPDHEDPPYDRDRHLPRPHRG